MQDCYNCWSGSGTGKRKRRKNNECRHEMDEHSIPIEELYVRLETNPNSGLSTDKAKEILRRDGPNVVTPKHTSPGKIKLIFKHLFTSFTFIPWVGIILCIVIFFTKGGTSAGEYVSVAIVLIAIIFLNAGCTFYQKMKLSKVFDPNKYMAKEIISVLRDGKRQTIETKDLVVGDIVQLKSGDRIPADIRIISAKGLKVDCSSLTGESEPLTKTSNLTSENPLETDNLVFLPTSVVEGSGSGVVVRTGDDTFMGDAVTISTPLQVATSPLKLEISRSIRRLTCIALLLGVTYCIIAFVVGYIWVDAIVFFIAIYVANVPQGLIVTSTILMGYTMTQMAKRNCAATVEAIETLASLTTICSDISITLTQSRKTVSHLWFDGILVKADKMSDTSDTTYTSSESWKALSRIAVLCNDAEFLEDQDNVQNADFQRQVSGNATDIALLQYAKSFGDMSAITTEHKILCDIPFRRFNKYQVVIYAVDTPIGHRNILLMKGAPEMILDKCNTVLLQNKEIPLNDNFRKCFNDAIKELGDLGEHILGFCDQVLPSDQYPKGYDFDSQKKNFPLSGLRFVGLVSCSDPIGSSIPDALRTCRSAGIKVVMVTGEHPITAKVVAKEIGIISGSSMTTNYMATKGGCSIEELKSGETNAVIVHGSDLQDIDSEQLDDILLNHAEVVFARITPQQKLIIVNGYQRHGQIVAVTGRSVDDSPALKAADIGIALDSGSDISKAAADMFLLDNSFASIISGVEQGRLMVDNLKKCIAYNMSSNLPVILPFLVFLIMGIPLPLGAFTILCINLVTDVLPTVSLVYEGRESGVMNRQPRNAQTDTLLNQKMVNLCYGQLGMIQTLAGLYAYFIVMIENGFCVSRLLNIRHQWYSPIINDLRDSFGQEWSYLQRKQLESSCHTSYFIAIVISQWACLLISKTRKSSLFQQGMKNQYLILALLVAAALAVFLTYCPKIDGTVPLYRATWWFPAMPFSLAIIIYDECRKYILRQNPGGFVEIMTYY